jgi:soluble lytic murein transglycosylase
MRELTKRVILTALVLGTVTAGGMSFSLTDTRTGSLVPSEDPIECEAVEACFKAAALPKERLGKVLTKEQVLLLKLERLKRIMERFPATLWAKRAGLLSGVLLIQQNPAVAIQFLRAAQRDFPVLDDYMRLWTGEALLNLGDAKQAAELLETIPDEVPSSNILPRAAYRTGEAWYQASNCAEAVAWFDKAVRLSDKEPGTAQALLRRAACQLKDSKITEARAALTQLWTRFPYTSEGKEANSLLISNLGGEPWSPQAGERMARAHAYLGQAFHAEAIDELRKFLNAEPTSPRRSEAKLKLGIAHVRLKQYEQARETFHGLSKNGSLESQEASVWLARVYLRLGQGDKLLELAKSIQASGLTAEQKGQIILFAGIWLEDQGQFDEAISRYRHVAKSGEPAFQRAEALWRVGWVYYRTTRYREAMEAFRVIADQLESDFAPQALYWMARASEQLQEAQMRDLYTRTCNRYVYTYYCQLAREKAELPAPSLPNAEPIAMEQEPSLETDALPRNNRSEIRQQAAYRRAIELKVLGLESDAAHELAVLTNYFGQDVETLMVLSAMLNEVGAYNHALRLARSRFKDKIERTGGAVKPSLWEVAYPTGLLPLIKAQNAKKVDPYLIAAIIREESQYDWKAVSRVGAIGLMQVMPDTANAVAQRNGFPSITRDDLFDQETNIRIGVYYVQRLLEQFSDNVVQTIAAYNAGPSAVENWMTLHGRRSQDEFVELIPYQETRQYVKRVLRSYREYLRLNASQPSLS